VIIRTFQLPTWVRNGEMDFFESMLRRNWQETWSANSKVFRRYTSVALKLLFSLVSFLPSRYQINFKAGFPLQISIKHMLTFYLKIVSRRNNAEATRTREGTQLMGSCSRFSASRLLGRLGRASSACRLLGRLGLGADLVRHVHLGHLPVGRWHVLGERRRVRGRVGAST